MAKEKLYPAQSNLGGSRVTAGWNIPAHLKPIFLKHGRFTETIDSNNKKGAKELYDIAVLAKQEVLDKEQELIKTKQDLAKREQALLEKEQELSKKASKKV